MILASHPTGNQNVRHAVLGMEKAGLLTEFHTSVATFEGNFFGKIAKTRLGKEFARRRFHESLRTKTKLHPSRELGRVLASKLGLHALTAHERGCFCVDKVYQSLDRYCAKLLDGGVFRAVYCYEDGAFETFSRAKALNIDRLYDLPIGYWREARRIQQEEAELKPEWASTMIALLDSEAKTHRKDSELRLASKIYVASSYTKKTLGAYPGVLPEAEVIPYGCPPVQEDIHRKEKQSHDPLKIIFVGGLSQRKGLSYLFEAVNQLGSSVSLTVVGRPPPEICLPLQQGLANCHWIESLPHEQVLETIAQHDVLVFPSLFEGFGLVITEALSVGVPVITTANTCGPDVLTEGKDGFIVPIRDSSGIAEKLSSLYEDSDRLSEMRQHALDKARKLTWGLYEDRLSQVIIKACEAL